MLFTIINQQYQKFTIEQQQTKWQKLSPMLQMVAFKAKKPEIKKLIKDLIKKTDHHLDELETEIMKIKKIREKMLIAINQEREEAGLSWLVLNSTLNTAAQLHAQYMGRTKDFAHTTKKWVKFNDRILAAGYTWLAMGENIAWNQKTIDEVIHDRMQSPWHRINILRPDFSELGVGFSKYYRVQDFWGN